MLYSYTNEGEIMKIFLLIISILLIIIVLLQSGKAEPASQIISGGNMDLFNKRKERGSELVISRITLSLGILFFVILCSSRPSAYCFVTFLSFRSQVFIRKFLLQLLYSNCTARQGQEEILAKI